MVRFYYYIEKRKTGKNIESHLSQEEDFSCEEEGVVCPNIYKKKEAHTFTYLIELDGVKSKEDIQLSLEPGDMLQLQATPSEKIIYHGLSKKTPIKEYQATIRVPLDIEAENIEAEFQEDDQILRIVIRRPKKSEEIEIK